MAFFLDDWRSLHGLYLLTYRKDTTNYKEWCRLASNKKPLVHPNSAKRPYYRDVCFTFFIKIEKLHYQFTRVNITLLVIIICRKSKIEMKRTQDVPKWEELPQKKHGRLHTPFLYKVPWRVDYHLRKMSLKQVLFCYYSNWLHKLLGTTEVQTGRRSGQSEKGGHGT